MCIIYKVIGHKSSACEYHACQDINQSKTIALLIIITFVNIASNIV